MDFIANGIAWPLLAWGVAGVLILAGAVAVDARERGQSAALWFLLALLFPGVGALAYLVLRPPGEPAAFPAAVAAERPQPAPHRVSRPAPRPPRPASRPARPWRPSRPAAGLWNGDAAWACSLPPQRRPLPPRARRRPGPNHNAAGGCRPGSWAPPRRSGSS